MNRLFLIGNLTRDPELTETNQGISVCRFTIAVNRRHTGQDDVTDFFNCSAWRGTAEAIDRYCKKGSKVAVSGSIQFREYTDNGGIKRTAADVIVHDVEFLTPKERREDDFYYEPTPRAPVKKKPLFQSFDDDGDIPF